MNSTTIGWVKRLPGDVQSLSNRQCFQPEPTRKINNKTTNLNRKKVRFNCRASSASQQAFENTEHNHLETNQSQNISFDDNDYTLSSSTNIFTDELPEIQNNPICSVRATVITFIVIVLIIMVAAIAIGVVLGTINTSQNTTSTKNSTQSLYSTMSTTLMTSFVSIGSQIGSPCSSYTTINDPSRNVAQIGTFGLCDEGAPFNTSSGRAWIRFIGSGGTTMPSSPPGRGHCGTYATGWFNSTLPVVLDTMVNGSVCFSTDVGDCFSYYTSSIIYCNGSFYIYYLKPAHFCNLRYCTI